MGANILGCDPRGAILAAVSLRLARQRLLLFMRL
jgi:hypothetical protein